MVIRAACRTYDTADLLIEAAVHSGDRVAAEYAPASQAVRSNTSTTPWARGPGRLRTRCCAVLATQRGAQSSGWATRVVTRADHGRKQRGTGG